MRSSLPASHHVPGDADAGREGPLGETEADADGGDPGREAVEVSGRPHGWRHRRGAVAVADPQSTRFATKEQADELALKIARSWVYQRVGQAPG